MLGVGFLLVPEALFVEVLLSSAALVCVGGWLVGLLFEICIVDASIFVAIVVVLCL